MSDIAEYMAKAPDDLTDGEIEEIIKYFREQRATFNATGKSPARSKPLDPEKAEAMKSISLDDIL